MIVKLRNPALLLYFLSYIMYLFFFKIYADKEIALIFKPMIVTSISFYYFFYNEKKVEDYKGKLHFVILLLLFIADNMALMLEEIFNFWALFIYLVVLILLFYILLVDSKLLERKQKKLQYVKAGLFSVFAFSVVAKIISVYWLTKIFSSYYNILAYIVLAIGVLVLGFYNFLKNKTTSSKFLLITFLSLFGSDIFYVLYKYYTQNTLWLYLSCAVEIPCYYLLVRYFISRDNEKRLTIQ